MIKFFIIVPFFIYTAVHILALFVKLQSVEADRHFWEALLGLFAIYVIIGWGI